MDRFIALAGLIASGRLAEAEALLAELVRLAPQSPPLMGVLAAQLADLPEAALGPLIAGFADEDTRRRLWLTRMATLFGRGDMDAAFACAPMIVPNLAAEAFAGHYAVADDARAFAVHHGLDWLEHPAALSVMGDGRPSSLVSGLIRIDDALVLGTSFVPVAQGSALVTGMVHNPLRMKSVLAWERYDSIVCGDRRHLLAAHTGRTNHRGPHLLLGSDGNFGHWLLNHFARLMIASHVADLGDCQVVVGNNPSSVQLACLARAGIDRQRIVIIAPGELAGFEDLRVPSMPFCVGHDGLISWAPALVGWIRALLAEPVGGKRKLFVSRRNARWRRLVNEAEVLAELAGQGFEIVDPGAMSLDEQIRLAGQAAIIAGPFGAGMNLLLFAPADCRIVEMKTGTPGMDINPHLARAIGQPYGAVIGRMVGTQDNLLNRDFIVDPDKVAAAVAD